MARKRRVDDEFAAMLDSGVSICGVSAAFATAGAVKGDPQKLSYVTSLVRVTAVPMMVIMPWIIRARNMDHLVDGAWPGGTLDTIGSVVAAGALGSEAAIKIRVIVKMSQKVLIGFSAFILAVVWTFKKAAPRESPGAIEIWYRFPNFVLGFMVASLIFSFILDPKTVNAVKGQLGHFRTWWFAMAFTCIGLETRFADLFKYGWRASGGGLLGRSGIQYPSDPAVGLPHLRRRAFPRSEILNWLKNLPGRSLQAPAPRFHSFPVPRISFRIDKYGILK